MNIKFILRSAVITAAALVALFSCAKRTSESREKKEQFALEAWIAKYAPNAIELGDYGIYYEVLEPAPDGAPSPKPTEWLFTDYIIRDMGWNVIYNRKEDIARRVGEYTAYTRYVPDYLAMPEDIEDMTIMQGMYYGFSDMKVGEKRRFYIPSKYGYGGHSMQNSFGYGGQYALNANSPLILDDVVINEIVPDPEKREKKLIEEFITQWGMTSADSLQGYDHFYYQILRKGEDTDTIPYGYDVEFYYTGRFVEDNAVFDTNIDSVWVNSFGELRRYDPVTPLKMMRKEDMSGTTSMPELTFSYLLPHLRYGDSLRVATVSRHAYQTQGKPGYRTTSTDPESDAFNNVMLMTYLYNMNGGMGRYGSDYYDYWYMMQYFMGGSTGNNQVTEPMPEVKLFTPVWFTIVVHEPDYSELETTKK